METYASVRVQVQHQQRLQPTDDTHTPYRQHVGATTSVCVCRHVGRPCQIGLVFVYFLAGRDCVGAVDLVVLLSFFCTLLHYSLYGVVYLLGHSSSVPDSLIEIPDTHASHAAGLPWTFGECAYSSRWRSIPSGH